MGDSEDKKIAYSAEELSEINRIINDNFNAQTVPVVDSTTPVVKSQGMFDDTDNGFDDNFGEPDDLDLPSGDYEFDKDSDFAVDEDDETPEDISNLISISDDELDDVTEIPANDLKIIEDVPDTTTEEPEDLSDLIEPLDDFTSDTTMDMVGSKPQKDYPRDMSPLGQLNALTEEEPESLDIQDISSDTYIDDTSDTDGIETLGASDLAKGQDKNSVSDKTQDGSQSIAINEDSDIEIPDLSEIDDLDDAGNIPDASEDDIPDIDIGDIGLDTQPEDSGGTEISMEESPHEDSFDDIPDIDDLDLDQPPIEQDDIIAINVPTADLGKVEKSQSSKSLGVIEPLDDDDEIEIAPLDDSVGVDDQTDSDFTDKDLKKLKKAILLFNPGLISAIKDTIVNDRLQPKDSRQLVDLILTGKPEDNVRRFLEKKLDRKINLVDESASSRRRVLFQRQEYTTEGRERQKRLLKITKIFGVSALITVTTVSLLYLLVYKPRKAKNIINQGVAIILKVGDEHKNFQAAEKLFQHVEDYQRDPLAFYKEEIFVYGCNEYGRAYFNKNEYNRSISKLNRAYNFKFNNKKKVDIDTLINLGYFYARVPKDEYRREFKSAVNKWYYHDPKTYATERSQLDVAIYLYKRALLQDPSNISALYGIGNAYSYQGEYIKAEKYYKDILEVNKNSVVGYSGLLNLYIDRNMFELVSKIHTHLKYKDMLHELPSALLAKLATYYLSKKRTDTQNLRIDYGVRSQNIIDKDDNPYPAVKSVLKALNERDPYYPPLQVQSALLARMQKNYQLMNIHLERALEYSKKYYNSDNYFAALHLQGEYFYYVKHPIKAYSYLKKAVEAHGNQPSFVREDFYTETEKIGHTYTIMGNVFYYYFEKAKLRFGDLDDDTIDKDMDRLASYNIARKKYEKAIAADYSSSELHYNLGRIFYLNREYQKALDSWIKLYDDFVDHPDIMFSLGNAYYHIQRYEAAKGEYLKLVSMYENDADNIILVSETNPRHQRIFNALASVYNNLGAVYQLQNNESKSHICYWKAIEYATKIQKENEYARVNLARGFRQRQKPEGPILDENIPFSIDLYMEPKD